MQATDLGKYLLYGAARGLPRRRHPRPGRHRLGRRAQRRPPTGPWTNPARVSRSRTGNRQLAVDGTGKLVAVWQRRRRGRIHLRGARPAAPRYPRSTSAPPARPSTGTARTSARSAGFDRRAHPPRWPSSSSAAAPTAGGRGTASAPPSRCADCPDHELGNGCARGARERALRRARPAATTRSAGRRSPTGRTRSR